ncbi:hypothetical protein L596_016035 [Steinernema carpocapsae]|uniref:Uncharacterized protein n=1 Tax=Steinernema carpocapsae TaxID=34508 RepID=A0A4U5NHS1_STECR|nr:hypothetical protein L596_016035 [Steinernema carpocapsae]
MEKTVEKFGKIDAGLGLMRSADQKSVEFYDLLNSVNCRSLIQLVQLAEPHLEKTKGNIVVQASPSPHTLLLDDSRR